MNQERKTNLVTGIIALGVVIGIIYAIVKFVAFILASFKNLNTEIGVAVIAACTTVLVSVLSVLISKWLERRAEIRREHRGKKVEIYESFIGIWFDILFASKLGQDTPSEKDTIKKLAPIIRQLVPWGSDEVIRSFVKFRDTASIPEKEQNKQNTIEMFDRFERLLLDIRKDLGHSCKNLKTGDLLKLFIIDYDHYKQEAK
ncbi:MAG: hypothetical protein ACYSSI_03595 [Planctomycetota bacterium]|jgi:hypothetical protein